MFEPKAAMEAVAILADTRSNAFQCFKAAAELKSIAEAAEAEALGLLAEENSWTNNNDDFEVIGQRFVRVGDDGTPLIDEALPLEVAAAMGSSAGTATCLLRDVVNLKERHPYTWEAIQEGVLPLWRAQQVSQTCSSFGLDAAETVQVDEQLRHVLGHVGWKRARQVLKAAIMKTAPIKVAEKIEAQRQARYCNKYSTDDPGVSFISACLDTADAIFFDAAVDRIADILGEQGDESDKDMRRAKAVGILGTPAHALQLMGTPSMRGVDETSPVPVPSEKMLERQRPTAQVYVHFNADGLDSETSVVRVEKLGPAMVSQLGQILGHCSIRLTPVLHVGDSVETPVDGYEVPRRHNEQVVLRDRYEVFPFSSRDARGLDMDHTNPYRVGVPGQTRPSNLGPLSRRAHRVKTHCGWQLNQPKPGWFEWTTRYGQTFTVGPDGTRPYHDRQ